MLRTPQVLLLTDGHSPIELHRALSLTAPFGGHVHALILASRRSPGLTADLAFQYTLSRFNGTPARDPDEITASFIDMSPDDPKQAILRYAERHHIDIMVVVRHPGPLRMLTADFSQALIREATCPVLTISANEAPVSPRHRRPHIFAPSDFSDCSQHALAHAREVAAILGGRITVFHAVQQKTMLHGADNPLLEKLIRNSTRPGYYVKPLKEMYRNIPGPDVETRFRVVKGLALRSIHQFLNTEMPDLIVLSTHGMTGIRHYPMGRTTEQILRQTAIPILLIKAFGKPLVPIHLSSFRQPAIASFTRLLFDTMNKEPAPRMKPSVLLRNADHVQAQPGALEKKIPAEIANS